jgi:hypothetical protein
MSANWDSVSTGQRPLLAGLRPSPVKDITGVKNRPIRDVANRPPPVLSENGCERILVAGNEQADDEWTGRLPMKRRIAIVSVVLFLGVVASMTNAAESKAVQTMAAILLHLQHFPSDADKQSLKQITEDMSATKDEHTVAQALMDVQHAAAAADKPKLEAIVKDDKASSSVKTLASIILNLKHMPSESDREKLKALTS